MRTTRNGLGTLQVASPARMMDAHIRGLVDTCFEEGHYESGLDILDKSRSPNLYPAPYHVRVLLYLALYPPPAPVPAPSATKSGLPLSPRKERYRKNLTPTPTASVQALNVLRAFTEGTSSLENLFRGLPARGKTYNEDRGGWQIDASSALFTTTSTSAAQSKVTFIPDVGFTGEENKVVRAAMLFTTPKDIWACLEEGFVKRIDAGAAVDPEDDIMGLKLLGNEVNPAKKGKSKPAKKRKSTYNNEEDSDDAYGGDMGNDDTFLLDEPLSSRIAVAEWAWLVLDWLLTVFEKDEEIAAQSSAVRRSQLLLSQIPVSSRTDLSSPLKVAFAALGSASPAQQSFALGMRLIRLIVSLTIPASPRSISPSGCLRQINGSLISHIDTYFLTLPLGFLESFFAGLPSTNQGFKLRLACAYLASRSTGGETSSLIGAEGAGTSQSTSTGGASKPKGTTRRPQPKGAVVPGISKTGSPGSIVTTTTTASTQLSDDPFPLPGVEEVLALLAFPIDLGLNRDEDDDEPMSSSPPTFGKQSTVIHVQQSFALRIRLDHATAVLQLLTAASRLVRPQKVQGELQEMWLEALIDGRLRKAFETALEVHEDLECVVVNADGKKKLSVLSEATCTILEAWEQQAAGSSNA
ncbi:hypothetical protein FRB94_014258 [Tulasnella sp. JGI-2019a]|nr:hypothetical protein FRB93_005390 [Tulasnella sp. JGI-2019a]KAG9014165.1 hypothetical protein FRB94_014258 [Tulasnella sp. JGI-2019a]